MNRKSRTRQLTDEQREEMKQAFQVFDLDNDGKLDYHGLKYAMKALGFDATKHEVLQLIKEYDPAGHRRISQDDFDTIMSAKIASRDPVEEMKRAFSLFDAAGRGKINFQDLKRVAQEIGEDIEDEELQAMIDVFDLDDDGYINLEEFLGMCKDD